VKQVGLLGEAETIPLRRKKKMKKFAIISLAALLVVAFTMPAAAFENEFGGYWRTRAYTLQNFNGSEPGGDEGNTSLVDTRTRLYYTAKFSDNFKFVNKFEMDAVWGGDVNPNNALRDYGDIGADGIAVEVKNSYVDFDMGPVNTKSASRASSWPAVSWPMTTSPARISPTATT
jgi:hypothetical protein